MAYIDFQHEGHVYQVDGCVVPSVTQVLEPLYSWSGIPPHVLAKAAERGTAVHKACELDDLEVLDESTLDEEITGYLAAWRKFREETGFEPDRVEARIYSRTHGFAGTVDRTGVMKRLSGRPKATVDIKSGVVTPVTGPQTAAYESAIQEQTGEKYKRRYGVYLRPGGDYRLIRYEEPNDWAMFRAARSLMTWRKNHGAE